MPLVSENFLTNGNYHVRMLQEALIETQKTLIIEENEKNFQEKILVMSQF